MKVKNDSFAGDQECERDAKIHPLVSEFFGWNNNPDDIDNAVNEHIAPALMSSTPESKTFDSAFEDDENLELLVVDDLTPIVTKTGIRNVANFDKILLADLSGQVIQLTLSYTGGHCVLSGRVNSYDGSCGPIVWVGVVDNGCCLPGDTVAKIHKHADGYLSYRVHV